MQVVLIRVGIVFPCRTAENAFPVQRLIAPDIPVALRVVFRRPRFDKPRMLIAGMVQDQVDDQLHAACMDFFHQRLEIFHRPEIFVDVPEVADVVAVVVVRRFVHRADPDDVDAEVF
jgi:hypothetical protein